MIGMNVSEQNGTKAAAACRNSCRKAIEKIRLNGGIFLFNPHPHTADFIMRTHYGGGG